MKAAAEGRTLLAQVELIKKVIQALYYFLEHPRPRLSVALTDAVTRVSREIGAGGGLAGQERVKEMIRMLASGDVLSTPWIALGTVSARPHELDLRSHTGSGSGSGGAHADQQQQQGGASGTREVLKLVKQVGEAKVLDKMQAEAEAYLRKQFAEGSL